MSKNDEKRTIKERLAIIEERTRDIPIIREKLETLQIKVAGTAATVAVIVTFLLKFLL